MKGAAASGHPLTTKAATDILSIGGNAFDAAVAAGFASTVTEPTLTSLGGGGFLLAHEKKQQRDILFDFFVNTPGLGTREPQPSEMIPVSIQFPACEQVFHVGHASFAVPGTLKGLLHVHRKLGRLSLAEVIAPALQYLDAGIETSALQGNFLGMLKPIFTLTPGCRDIYICDGKYARAGDRLYNADLKKFFEGIVTGESDLYSGSTAERLIEEVEQHNGLLTMRDLQSYEVIEREPLRASYRGREILTNPSPSFGGSLLELCLKYLERLDIAPEDRDSEKLLTVLVELIRGTSSLKPDRQSDLLGQIFSDKDIGFFLNNMDQIINGKSAVSTQGTTHISVIDSEGNAASLTTSNGTGSGCLIPGTGIMINNMMGEDDLHPGGFFSSTPGRRVSSMMMPAIVKLGGQVDAVLGSGGSKRIRSAMLQVIVNLIDFRLDLKEAVESPRIHFEDGIVQAEPGKSIAVIEKIARNYKLNSWDGKNMYFGGVHCVSGKLDGWGDSRRGGTFAAI